jgi:hypothetical protein
MTDIAVAGTFRLADVFSKSTVIYSRHFATFIVLTLLASIPYYLVWFVIRDLEASSFAAMLGLKLLDIATDLFAGSAVIYGVVQQLRGRAFSVSDSIRIAFRRFLPMFGVAVYSTIVIALGTVALVVPGIIAACMYYVAEPVCIAERADIFTSISRSSSLTEGHRVQAFGMLLLSKVAAIAFFAMASAISEEMDEIATLIVIGALAAVINPFSGVLIGVFYFELRVAKEGVDNDKIATVFD